MDPLSLVVEKLAIADDRWPRFLPFWLLWMQEADASVIFLMIKSLAAHALYCNALYCNALYNWFVRSPYNFFFWIFDFWCFSNFRFFFFDIFYLWSLGGVAVIDLAQCIFHFPCITGKTLFLNFWFSSISFISF